jgi:hypothetical protein
MGYFIEGLILGAMASGVFAIYFAAKVSALQAEAAKWAQKQAADAAVQLNKVAGKGP